MQHPHVTDGVLGGYTPPPTSSAILGGLEGLQQQMAVASPDQRSHLLSLALSYGEAGIDWLINVFNNDPVLTVRAAAYQHLLQAIANSSQPGLERVEQAIAQGVPLKRGDRVYQMYISAIDYDDEYHTLLDSVEAFSAHEFCYDEQFHPVERYIFKEQAEQVAADLHRVILSNSSFKDFNQRHHLNLNPAKLYLLNISGDLSTFYRNDNQPVHEWCVAHGVDIDLSDYLSDMPEDVEEDQGYWWEVQEVVLQYLQDQRNYPLLEELSEFIGIGKFAFVHEQIVHQDSFFTRLKPIIVT
jgi:hypothetical protein